MRRRREEPPRGLRIAAVALIGIPFAACAALYGPATQPPACPVLCGHYEGAAVCCGYHQECSRTGWPDMPCRPRSEVGAARDGGK